MSSRAGKRDRMVDFERDITDFDDREDAEPGKKTVQTISAWAELLSISSRERLGALAGNQSLAIRTVKIRILWEPNIKSKDRFWLDERLYNIVGISEIGRYEMLEILAEEVVREGER